MEYPSEQTSAFRIPDLLARSLAPLCLLGLMAIPGCSTSPPRNMADACEIFEEKDDWYEASDESFDKWGVPIHVQLAIIHQESRFEQDAKPPREKLFWFIPWFRK
ncbi:MAG: hypothetical protein KME53_19375, partial [Candidatus Thiodiazotropha sp. (ex Clathrolucina costata)]|nr:hypothetical protein [Candidatus Thiodiazotropha taylori]